MKKILILAANPKDTPRFRLDEEVREIENGLRRAKHRDEFELRQQWATRTKDIRRAMLDAAPDIVHFCGRGEGETGIAFEDETGQTHFVSTEALAGFFELFADTVDCVVLNACYSEVQARAIAEHIKYVIGMSQDIDDRTGIEFAVAFYDALGAGRTVEFAYKLACNAIQMAGIDEHLVPVLLKTEGQEQEPVQSSTARRNSRTGISHELNKKIVGFLTSIPNMHDNSSQRALIYSAGLDQALLNQIQFSGSPAQIFQLLVPMLVSYGTLEDGRDALEALLEAAKDYVGRDRKEYCEELLQELRAV